MRSYTPRRLPDRSTHTHMHSSCSGCLSPPSPPSQRPQQFALCWTFVTAKLTLSVAAVCLYFFGIKTAVACFNSLASNDDHSVRSLPIKRINRVSLGVLSVKRLWKLKAPAIVSAVHSVSKLSTHKRSHIVILLMLLLSWLPFVLHIEIQAHIIHEHLHEIDLVFIIHLATTWNIYIFGSRTIGKYQLFYF